LFGCLCGWQDNKVQGVIRRWPNHQPTKTFPHDTLDPVTTHGFGTGFFGDSHAQSVALHSIGSCQNSKVVITRTNSLLKNLFEF